MRHHSLVVVGFTVGCLALLAPGCDGTPPDGGGGDAGEQGDAGPGSDAGGISDAGADPDAGTMADGGMEDDAGTQSDAGMAADGGLPFDGGAGLVFASDWGTALGSGDDALRDTGKLVPWTELAGTGLSVIPSTGLDFPTPNVLEVSATETTPGSADIRFGHTRLIGLPIPAVGESLFYRWYLRVAVPDALDSINSGAPHPIQDGTSASQSNWMFETVIQQNGTWGPRLFSFAAANAFPNNRWGAPAPFQKNQTYRIELQIHRVGTSTFTPHARVFDSAGGLLYGDADIANQGGGGTVTFADAPVLDLNILGNLTRLQAGNNAPNWVNLQSADFPFVMYYQGAFCVRTDTWCGPWQQGEGT